MVYCVLWMCFEHVWVNFLVFHEMLQVLKHSLQHIGNNLHGHISLWLVGDNMLQIYAKPIFFVSNLWSDRLCGVVKVILTRSFSSFVICCPANELRFSNKCRYEKKKKLKTVEWKLDWFEHSDDWDKIDKPLCGYYETYIESTWPDS